MYTRLELIRKGMVEPSPFRLDELKAWDQGRKARLILRIYAASLFLVFFGVCVAIRVENPPADNGGPFSQIEGIAP